MRIRMEPGRAAGTVPAPPSKSYAHRLLICAALAEGQSVIHGIAPSEDVLATLDCIRALGADYEIPGGFAGDEPRTAVIQGGRRAIPDGTVFPCRESGSTLRFFLPLALGDAAVRLTGSARLMERGAGVYGGLLREKGVRLEADTDGIEAQGRLTPGEYALTGNVSSQYISGLLFALPLLDGDSVIRVLPPVESRAYIDITLDVLWKFGVCVRETEPNVFLVPGGQRYRAQVLAVEGDWSNAAALYLFNNLGGDVRVTGLEPSSTQGDRVCAGLLERLRAPGAEIDLSNCPDLGPVLFAAAAAGQGGVFTGTRRLRIKESDRAQAMAEELGKFGVRVLVEENRAEVLPGGLHAPSGELDSHNDHRIVMAAAALLSRTGGVLNGAEAIRKSFPSYFETLRRLGLEVHDGF